MYERPTFILYVCLFVACCFTKIVAYADTTDMTTKRHGSFSVHALGKDISVSVPVENFRDVKLFTLTSPYRIVLDITNDETFYAGTKHFSSASPFIKEIRVSHKSGTYRFVAETTGNATLLRYGVLKPIRSSDAHVVQFTLQTTKKQRSATSENITPTRKPSKIIVANKLKDTTTLSSATSDAFIPVVSSKPDVPPSETTGLPPLSEVLRPVIEEAERNVAISAASKETPLLVRKPGTFHPLIVIDAGHGGRDPGALGSHKREKNITLIYAKYVADYLRKTGRYKARLTRDRDIFIPLRERVEIAEKLDADFFISLHADSLPSKPNLRGLSIYTLSENASDKEAQFLARQENAAGELFDNEADINDNITDALVRLVQRDTMNRSAFFAGEFVNHVPDGVPTLRNTHRFAGFRVLAGVRIPSALIEMGYMSNKKDENMLGSKKHQKIVAHTIVKSLDTLFHK